MRRRAMTIAVSALLTTSPLLAGAARGQAPQAPSPPSTNAPPPSAGKPSVRIKSFSEMVVTSETPTQAGPAATNTAMKGASHAAAVPTWSFWIYNYVDGVFCRQRVTTRSEARAAGLVSYATQVDLPVCARAPTGQPQRGPDDAARDFWDLRVLPDPVLEVVPGYALTGKPVYLQIHGDPARSFDVDNPLGDDVAISADSTYEIDWGDHSPTRITTSQGGPWPDGDVTHTYTVVNSATTITVTQRWTASWRAGADGGQLDGLQTSATLTLPVTQLQAVRNT